MLQTLVSLSLLSFKHWIIESKQREMEIEEFNTHTHTETNIQRKKNETDWTSQMKINYFFSLHFILVDHKFQVSHQLMNTRWMSCIIWPNNSHNKKKSTNEQLNKKKMYNGNWLSCHSWLISPIPTFQDQPISSCVINKYAEQKKKQTNN